MSDKNSKKQFKKLYLVAGVVFSIIVFMALSAFNIWFGRDVFGFGWHIPQMVQDCANGAEAKNCEYLGGLGVLGDFFGGILNPILAFITFGSVLYTIKLQQDSITLQQNSIELQREELKAAREEFAKSANAQEEQAKIFKLQQFENTFFSLFSQIVSIHSNLVEKRGEEGSKLDIIISEINALSGNNKIRESIFKGEADFNNIQYIIKRHSEFNQFTLLVYQELKLIKEHWQVNGDSILHEKKYGNILRASLNPIVLQLLLFRCYKNTNYLSYKNLIERYGLFEHMPFLLDMDKSSPYMLDYRWIYRASEYYGSSAFGKSVYFDQEINRETERLLENEKVKDRIFFSWGQFKQKETELFKGCYFTETAREDYQKITHNQEWQGRTQSIDFIIEKIIEQPDSGYGVPEPLQKELKGLWIKKAGAGELSEKIIYTFENDKVFIIAIMNYYGY